jgi:hypothetical protein
MPALPPTHNPWNHVPPAKEEDQKSPGQKTANVRPPRRSPKALEIHDPREKLEQKPKAQEYHRRYLHKLEEKPNGNKGEDAGPREKDEVGAHDSGNRSRCAHHGNSAFPAYGQLKPGRANPTKEVKKEIPAGTHGGLNIVPKDPEVPHVTDDVEPTSVEEHSGENGEPDRERNSGRKIFATEKFCGDEAILDVETIAWGHGIKAASAIPTIGNAIEPWRRLAKRVTPNTAIEENITGVRNGQSVEKDDGVQGNQDIRSPWTLPANPVIPNGKHRTSILAEHARHVKL